jgi:competence protein ComEA
VADAIKAAGGFSRKDVAGSINLAARIDDGQQIVVGMVATGAGGASDSTVSLNSGTEADFDSLPGVGPVLAGRIVAWRTEHKRFTAIDELQEVPGIGPKVFANLKDLVRV